MWNWVSNNSDVLEVIASFGTLIVWLSYFQLLYVAFRRHRQTTILVNRGVGSDLEARCLISNMSPEPVYVQSVIATLQGADETFTVPVTDFGMDGADVQDIRVATKQGPLSQGEYMDIGTFSDVMAHAARKSGLTTENPEKRFDRMDLTVVAAYGSEDLSVAATRGFALRGESGGQNLVPLSVSTHQIRSRRKRKELDDYVAQDL